MQLFILKMNKLNSLLSIRGKQLEKEEKLDNIIESSKTNCPLLIINYYLERRRINYNQYKTTDDTPFYNKPSVILQFMKKNEEDIDNLMNRISETSVCQALSNIDY